MVLLPRIIEFHWILLFIFVQQSISRSFTVGLFSFRFVITWHFAPAVIAFVYISSCRFKTARVNLELPLRRPILYGTRLSSTFVFLN